GANMSPTISSFPPPKSKPVDRERNGDHTSRLAKMLRIPPAEYASQIRGNTTLSEKELIAGIFSFFIKGGIMENAFGKSIGERVKMVEMNLEEDAAGQGARTNGTWEVEVTQDMCNAFGTMHGACAAFLLDHATLGTLVFLGRARGFDGVGMTTTMNLNWHTPAQVGDVISIYAESVFVDKGGRGTRVARCQILEKSSGRLIVTGTAGGVASGLKL
ncbi:hypothetical protein C8F01DRAFT_1179881, partial [Mycena amicta]